MKRYSVVARREGRLWSLEVAAVPGALSMVRRLDQAEEHIREAIAYVLDIPADSFAIALRTEVPPEWDEKLRNLAALRHSADQAASAASSASRALASELKAAGLSVRDAGLLMGVSPQRVSQLLAG